MRGAITPLRQYVFMGLCLVKHRDNFTFTFTFTFAFLTPKELWSYNLQHLTGDKQVACILGSGL